MGLEMDELNPMKANNLLSSGKVSINVALSFVLVTGIIGFLFAVFTFNFCQSRIRQKEKPEGYDFYS